MKWLAFSCYRSYCYFLIYWITSLFVSIWIALDDNKTPESQEKNTNIILSEKLTDLIIEIGGDLLAGFLVLYTFLKTNSIFINITNNNLINEDSELNSYEPLKKMNKCTLILIVSIIEFINKIFYNILSLFYNRLKDQETLWLISIVILSRIFFSHYILKIKLYKFHIVSLILYLIGFSLMGILAFCAGDIDLKKWPFLLFIIFLNILNGLEDVLIKFLFTNKYLLPHILMFLRGLYNLGMAIILIIVLKISGFEFIFQKYYYYLIYLVLSLILFFKYF